MSTHYNRENRKSPRALPNGLSFKGTSVAELKRQFRRDVRAAVEQIEARTIYIDTVNVLLRYPLTKTDVVKLRRMLGRKIHFERSRSRSFPYRVRIHQPTKRALRLIAKSEPHIVNRVDVALDLCVQTIKHANELIAFLHRHMTQPRRGKQRRVIEWNGTVYFARPWSTRTIAIYSEVSRRNRAPCTHVEFRFAQAKSCRQRGFHQLDDLINSDAASLAATILEHCRLSFLNWAKIERAIDDLVGNAMLAQGRKRRTLAKRQKTRRSETRQKLTNMLARILQTDDIEARAENLTRMPVQNWIDCLPDLTRRAIVNLPAHDLIISPGRANARSTH